MTETQFNTPIFNDPQPCENLECTDGYVKNDFWDYDHNIFLTEKKKCPYCDEYGNKIK